MDSFGAAIPMNLFTSCTLTNVSLKNLPQVNFPPHATKSHCSKIVYKCAVNRMSLYMCSKMVNINVPTHA